MIIYDIMKCKIKSIFNLYLVKGTKIIILDIIFLLMWEILDYLIKINPHINQYH